MVIDWFKSRGRVAVGLRRQLLLLLKGLQGCLKLDLLLAVGTLRCRTVVLLLVVLMLLLLLHQRFRSEGRRSLKDLFLEELGCCRLRTRQSPATHTAFADVTKTTGTTTTEIAIAVYGGVSDRGICQ